MSTVTLDGHVYETREFKVGGKEYKVRELTVAENDECSDASKGNDGISNGRTMMRLMMLKAVYEPKLEAEDISGLPQRLYLKLCDEINDLSDPRTLVEDSDDPPAKGSRRSTS